MQIYVNSCAVLVIHIFCCFVIFYCFFLIFSIHGWIQGYGTLRYRRLTVLSHLPQCCHLHSRWPIWGKWTLINSHPTGSFPFVLPHCHSTCPVTSTIHIMVSLIISIGYPMNTVILVEVIQDLGTTHCVHHIHWLLSYQCWIPLIICPHNCQQHVLEKLVSAWIVSYLLEQRLTGERLADGQCCPGQRWLQTWQICRNKLLLPDPYSLSNHQDKHFLVFPKRQCCVPTKWHTPFEWVETHPNPQQT